MTKGNKEIVIPEESYELRNIEKYLKRVILQSYHCCYEKEDVSQRDR